MDKILLKCVQCSPLLHVIILFLGTFISFLVSYFNGNVSLYLPFVSETGAHVPAMCIFSLSLILGSYFGCIFLSCKYIIFSSALRDERLLQLNRFSYIVGLGSMLGLAGVAAFPMSTVYSIHLLFAAMYFIGITSYFVLTSYMHLKVEGISVMNKFRVIICILLLLSLFLLVIFFPIAQSNWKKQNKIAPAYKIPENNGFTLILISSLLEWAIVILFVLHISSFMPELKKFEVDFGLTPKQYNSDHALHDNGRIENSPS